MCPSEIRAGGESSTLHKCIPLFDRCYKPRYLYSFVHVYDKTVSFHCINQLIFFLEGFFLLLGAVMLLGWYILYSSHDAAEWLTEQK